MIKLKPLISKKILLQENNRNKYANLFGLGQFGGYDELQFSWIPRSEWRSTEHSTHFPYRSNLRFRFYFSDHVNYKSGTIFWGATDPDEENIEKVNQFFKKLNISLTHRNFKLDVINENDDSHVSERNLIYHITKKENINSIKQRGLIPNVPDEMPNEERAVYFFKSKDDALDGFANWYAERYDDDEEFLLLTVNDVGLRLFSSLHTFEYICYETVPPENIKKIEEIS